MLLLGSSRQAVQFRLEDHLLLDFVRIGNCAGGLLRGVSLSRMYGMHLFDSLE